MSGKLDDPLWSRAATTAAFVEPGDGSAARGHEVAAYAKLGRDDREALHRRRRARPLAVLALHARRSGPARLGVLRARPGHAPARLSRDNRDYHEMQFDVTARSSTRTGTTTTPPSRAHRPPPRRSSVTRSGSCKAERAEYLSDGHFYSVEIAIPWARPAGLNWQFRPEPGDVCACTSTAPAMASGSRSRGRRSAGR